MKFKTQTFYFRLPIMRPGLSMQEMNDPTAFQFGADVAGGRLFNPGDNDHMDDHSEGGFNFEAPGRESSPDPFNNRMSRVAENYPY